MTLSSRVVWLPLFFYLAITLGVPLASGRHPHAGFAGHAATLLIAAASFGALRVLLRRRHPTSEDM